jgi:hypothetical protein
LRGRSASHSVWKQVIVGDTTCLAVDTGKHVVTRRAARKAGRTTTERNAIVIDRFFETRGQALAWTKRNPQFMTVRVLSPNESRFASNEYRP